MCVLKTKWPSSVMEPHSNLCQLSAEIAVWLHHTACFIVFYASDHWPASLHAACFSAVSSIPTLASVPGFSFMQYGCGAENTAKKKSLVDFDHVGTVTCNGMQFCHTSYAPINVRPHHPPLGQ